MPGRSTSGFHGPGRHRVHENAKSLEVFGSGREGAREGGRVHLLPALVIGLSPILHRLRQGDHIKRVYRPARPRVRWYQLRGLPLVGSECVCLQCKSSFVIARGSDMPSAIDLPARITRSQELTRNANNDSGTP